MTATLYRGWTRETEVAVDLTLLGDSGYATTPCRECEGTGWWAYAEPEVPGAPCVECKGTKVITLAV